MATGPRIRPEELETMIRLYDQLGTYAGVAKEMGRSASTIAKYIKRIKSHNNITIELANLVREKNKG